MDNEKSINAFAAGFSTDDAVIGVNHGTVELLTRDELQGVIAHEFSHIINGDMRMNMRLLGILYGLQALAIVGVFMIRFAEEMFNPSESERKKSGDGNFFVLAIGLFSFAVGVALAVLGYIGVFFSMIIKAAISRQREFLADASAVQFTRNPDGIAGALKKIGCPAVGSNVMHSKASEASHLFFGSVSGLLSLDIQLLSSHPDLTTRIKRIDPQFDGKFPQQIAPASYEDAAPLVCEQASLTGCYDK